MSFIEYSVFRDRKCYWQEDGKKESSLVTLCWV